MGTALGASGWAMGGVTGMRAVGIAKTTYDGVVGALDVATDFVPGGGVAKRATTIATGAKKGAQKLKSWGVI